MIDRLLELLSEDLGAGDITSESVIPEKTTAKAVIAAKEKGLIAGLEEAALLFEHFNLKYALQRKDGERVEKGDVIARIEGDLRCILRIERLVLNLISRMSGIATLTSEFSRICAPYHVKVMGTRKTTPGFRSFEKKAIEVGGGMPHRKDLSDEVLIKDNHLALIGIEEAVKRGMKANPGKAVEVEVSSLEDATRAAEAGAGILLLDNLSAKEARSVIDGLKKKGLRKRVVIELSGGINSENIEDYAKTGADRISLGCLTTDARWLDISMKVIP